MEQALTMDCSTDVQTGVIGASIRSPRRAVRAPRLDTGSSEQLGYVLKSALPDRGGASELLAATASFHRHTWLLPAPVLVTETGAPWLAEVHEELYALTGLDRNWDGHGGMPVAQSSYDKAASFVATVSEPGTARPSVVPTAEGGVQVEWHTGGFDVEAYFPPDGAVSFYVHEVGSGREVDLDAAKQPEIASLLTVISRRRRRWVVSTCR